MTDVNSIITHSGIGNVERDDVARECEFCGEAIPPREWRIVSYYYPDDRRRRKPFRVCVPCADVIAWAAEAGWEEDGVVDPDIADGWAHRCLTEPVTHDHYRAQPAARAYKSRRAAKADKEWRQTHGND